MMQDAHSRIAIFTESGVQKGWKVRGEVNRTKDVLQVVVILLEKEESYFLTKPTITLWKGRWGSSAARMVQDGETAEAAAQRTIARELNLSIPLTKHAEKFYNFQGIKRWLVFFHGRTSQKILLNREDAVEGKWFPKGELPLLLKMPTLEAALQSIVADINELIKLSSFASDIQPKQG